MFRAGAGKSGSRAGVGRAARRPAIAAKPPVAEARVCEVQRLTKPRPGHGKGRRHERREGAQDLEFHGGPSSLADDQALPIRL